MKIAFVWDWTPEYWQSFTWADGLAAALVELQKRGHEVKVYADTDLMIPNPMLQINPIYELDGTWPDVFLHWADMTRPNLWKNLEYNKPMALCFAGGERITIQTEEWDHIFVESKTYYDTFKEKGFPVSMAFGTNTDLFKPVQQTKIFDTIFPATFAGWKRHNIFAESTKNLLACAVGFMYKTHEQECWQVCVDAGNLVLPHVSAEVLHRMYASSKTVAITSESIGGSQRTVLESLAMNIPCIVTDSDKYDYDGVIRVEPTAEAVKQAILDYRDKETDTREYILNNWSHIQYADNLEKGLLSICR
jgi:glycosyltransferase involved in cell wall biosynthesis